jgi:small subunit ribosomal protein S4
LARARRFKRRTILPACTVKGKKRKQSEYAIQLAEKQKAKYIYGVLERQFENIFDKATRKKGVTGEVLLQMLESRLDNMVYRLGIAPTRRAARQLVVHKHITVNGEVVNIPSVKLTPWRCSGCARKIKITWRPSQIRYPFRAPRNIIGLSGKASEMEGKMINLPLRSGYS